MTRYSIRRLQIGRLTDQTVCVWQVIEHTRPNRLMMEEERALAVLPSDEAAKHYVAELSGLYRRGLIDGMTRFAWWAVDGRQMVGTCGTTLEQAIKDLDRELIGG